MCAQKLGKKSSKLPAVVGGDDIKCQGNAGELGFADPAPGAFLQFHEDRRLLHSHLQSQLHNSGGRPVFLKHGEVQSTASMVIRLDTRTACKSKAYSRQISPEWKL